LEERADEALRRGLAIKVPLARDARAASRDVEERSVLGAVATNQDNIFPFRRTSDGRKEGQTRWYRTNAATGLSAALASDLTAFTDTLGLLGPDQPPTFKQKDETRTPGRTVSDSQIWSRINQAKWPCFGGQVCGAARMHPELGCHAAWFIFCA